MVSQGSGARRDTCAAQHRALVQHWSWCPAGCVEGHGVVPEGRRKGDTDSKIRMGLIYMEGQGFKPDRSKAMDWYLKEVMKGHSATQFRIGRKFDEGPGVLDYTKALQWYRLSATQGNVAGQFKVGEMYEMGKGTPQDFSDAFAWFLRAANQGHMDSQIRVSNFYTLGRGVPKDLIKAFEWTDKVIATPTATWRRLRQDLVRGLNADDEREAAPSGKRNRSSVAEK